MSPFAAGSDPPRRPYPYRYRRTERLIVSTRVATGRLYQSLCPTVVALRSLPLRVGPALGGTARGRRPSAGQATVEDPVVTALGGTRRRVSPPVVGCPIPAERATIDVYGVRGSVLPPLGRTIPEAVDGREYPRALDIATRKPWAGHAFRTAKFVRSFPKPAAAIRGSVSSRTCSRSRTGRTCRRYHRSGLWRHRSTPPTRSTRPPGTAPRPR